jgi:hypothetical protein
MNFISSVLHYADSGAQVDAITSARSLSLPRHPHVLNAQMVTTSAW